MTTNRKTLHGTLDYWAIRNLGVDAHHPANVDDGVELRRGRHERRDAETPRAAARAGGVGVGCEAWAVREAMR